MHQQGQGYPYQQYAPQQQYGNYNPYQMQMMFQQMSAMLQPQVDNYQFQNEFPRLKDYAQLDQLAEVFPHLKNINTAPYNPELPPAKFYVLRSSNDDDIHKAIKYNCWTSTPQNNLVLEKVYQEAKQNGYDVYIFYSVVKSGQFVGVAKMVSGFQNKKFSLWWQTHKFNQQFQLEWMYIKDVSYKQLNGVLNKEGNSITRSRDGTEIDFEHGKKVIEIFSQASPNNSIFQDFAFMDMREDLLRTNINQIQQQKQNQKPQ